MMQITKIGIILLIWYILWAGFRILTGGSDEKAIKQRKKTILRAIISIIIMWFVYAIVLWFISALEGGS